MILALYHPTKASVCEEFPSKCVAVLECVAGSRKPCCNLEYIRGIFGRLRENLRFPLFSQWFCTCALCGGPGPGRLQKDTETKEVAEQLAPLDLLGSGLSQKPLIYDVPEGFCWKPLPVIYQFRPFLKPHGGILKLAEVTFIFLCFPMVFDVCLCRGLETAYCTRGPARPQWIREGAGLLRDLCVAMFSTGILETVTLGFLLLREAFMTLCRLC